FALVLLGSFGWLHRRRTLPRLDAGSRRPFVRLAAVEVAVMTATIGLAVGLSRTPTPLTGNGSTSAAESLLGYPLPPPPTPVRLVFDAHVDATWLGILVVCAALYATGTRVLARRGDTWQVGRSVAWYGGLAVVLFVTSGGVGRYAPVMFSVHMVQHMALNMVAPILLVLGAPVTLALRALPARDDGSGVRRLLVDLLHSRVVRVLTHPLVAAAIFVTGLYLVYFTTVYDALMEDHWGHFLMQAHFLLSGALFFWVLVGLDPGTRRLAFPLRMGLLLAVMAMHAFFSVALMSYGKVIGAAYYAVLDRPWRTDLVADQHLGGGIGWAFGEIPVLLVLAALFVQWIRADRREAAAYDRMLDRQERAEQANGGPPAA
ncbi:MAG TPA: cytochrome c oxidase assembly protein, partial [Streptosporangiales bacterium]